MLNPLNDFRRRFRVMRLYTHDLQSIPTIELAPGDTIAPLDPGHIDILREVYAVEMAEERSRLDRGETCYVGWSGGRAAHYCWIQDQGLHEIRGTWRRERVRPGDFWLYSARTAEWARGRRLLPAALAAILREYRRRGYRRALAYIAEENTSSIKATERTGFVLEGRIRSMAWRTSLMPLPGSSYQNSIAKVGARTLGPASASSE